MLNRDDDHDQQVRENRAQWLRPLGINPHETYRVCLTYTDNDDYCRYREVLPGDAAADEYDAGNQRADALITTRVGQALFLPLADCIGAVLFDEAHGVLMLTHLGRHSLEQDGGVRSVQYLADRYGCRPEELTVWLSAGVGKGAYTIFALDNKGLKEVAFEQFARAGVKRAHINDTPHDTATDNRYYSHSEFLQGNKPDDGRHAVVAMMTAPSLKML